MIIVTIEHLPGYEITEVLGVVYGSTVRAKHLGSDIAAAFKNLAGGELKGYMDLLEQSRKVATERMVAQAEKLGADAIIGVRYYTSNIMQGASEIFVTGTAVKVRKKE